MPSLLSHRRLDSDLRPFLGCRPAFAEVAAGVAHRIRNYLAWVGIVGAVTAASAQTQISIPASQMALPSPWVYSTDSDSPEGAWKAPWATQASVTGTVALGQTIPAGAYSVFLKVLDYDRHNTATFTLGGTTSPTLTFEDRDSNGYWTSNQVVVTVSGASSISVTFNRAMPGIQDLRWFQLYITSDTNETVLRDDLALVFKYPGTAQQNNAGPNKGNRFPNSSFEAGYGGWQANDANGAIRRFDVSELWSTAQAWHGTRSMRLPVPTSGNYLLSSVPVTLASNKVHTFSAYVKTAHDSATVNLYLRSLYTAPNPPAVFEDVVSQIIGTSWTRISKTTTNLPYYPNGQYFLQFVTQAQGGIATDVYIDGIQVEELFVSAWQPKADFEFDAQPSDATRIFWTNDAATLTVRGYNNAASSATKLITVRAYNFTNGVTWNTNVSLSAGSSNFALSALAIPTTEKGHFRAWLTLTNQETDREWTWLMIEPPTTNGFDTASYFGAHMNADSNVLSRAQRLGVKWQRALSFGRVRWSEVEPVQGTFIWPDLSVYTNFGIANMLNLGENSPSWITNKLDITNYFGAFVSNAVYHYTNQLKGGLAAIEIWNEPQLDGTEIPSLAYYTEVLRIGATVIKAMSPALTVVGGGGLSTSAEITTVWNGLGADTSKIDVMSLHEYPPHENVAADAMTNNIIGLGVPAIWNTESGIPEKGSYTFNRVPFRTAGHYVVPWKSADLFYDTLNGTVEAMSRNFLTCIAYGQQKMFYYGYGQRNLAIEDFVSVDYEGLERDDATRVKMACLVAMFRRIDKSTGMGKIILSDNPDTLAYGFTRGSTPLVAYWSANRTNKFITLAGSVSAGNLRVYNMMGNHSTPASLALYATHMPLIVEGVGGTTWSNLNYAFANASVTVRADTNAPVLTLTAVSSVTHPSAIEYHLRWLGIDDQDVPEERLADGTTYRYSVNGAAYSTWNGDTWVNLPGLPTSFSVQGRDTSGNMAQVDISGGGSTNVPIAPTITLSGNMVLRGSLILK